MKAYSEDTRTVWVVVIFSTFFLGVMVFYVLPPNLFWKYPIAAQNWIDGTLEAERLIDFSPLYLYLHILARNCLMSPESVILWVQIILTSTSAGFFFLLLRRWYTGPIALLSTLIFVTNHSVIVYTGTFEPEPLLISFILGYLVFAIQSGTSASLFAGVFLSLSLLTRFNFFLLIFLTPLSFHLRERNLRKTLRNGAMFLLPVAIAVSFLTVRNGIVAGKMTPIGMNPGHVFFEGNNPVSTGESAIYPPLVYDSRQDFPPGSDYRHEIYRIFLRRVSEKPISVSESNRYWMSKAKNFIIDHPGRFFSLLLTKIKFFFHGFKRHDIWYLEEKHRRVEEVLPSVPFALISALALVGMILSAGDWKQKLPVYALFFTQFGVMMLTYVSERQRVAIIAVLILFAGEAIQAILRKKRYVLISLFSILLAILLHIPDDLIRDDIHLITRTRLCDSMVARAFEYRRISDSSMAAQANVSAFAFAPWRYENIRLAGIPFMDKSFERLALEAAISFDDETPSARFDLAVLYIADNQLEEAEAILKNLIRGGYRFNRRYTQCSQPGYYLARICQGRGDLSGAVKHLESALERNPGDPWVLSFLNVLTDDDDYRQRLIRYFDEIDAAFFLGEANLYAGVYEAAVKNFSYIVSRLPEYRKGLIYYSLSMAAVGKYHEAAQIYLTALEMRRDYIFKEEEIIRMFVRQLNENPHESESKINLQRILKDFGHGKGMMRLDESRGAPSTETNKPHKYALIAN
ncbi:MAG: hypothetical protein C4530_07460 [Desulfobacteraceae bacterium]|nr:MAG: hypothetical protein C4530_07460 [Desulfobacteraceae bacterium]